VKKILVATGNPGKSKEIVQGLKPLVNKGLKVLSLKDLKIKEKIEETGKTFRKNSLLKARFFSKLTNLPTIADDGGLVIPYLNNKPGVLSRRWPGYEASDNKLIEFCLNKLRGVKKINRTAYLETCITFFVPGHPKGVQAQKRIKGRIAQKPSPKRVKGYPFRALFIVDKYNKYYDNLTKEEHQLVNHRLKAIEKLVSKISNLKMC